MQGGVFTRYDQLIDNEAVVGLTGTNNSLAYKVEEIERHFHSKECWLGKLAVQTATDNATADFLIGLHEYEG